MRSIFVFTNASTGEIGRALDGFLERDGGEWFGSRVASAWIDEPPPWWEFQHLDLENLETSCGGPPARLVVVNISGAIDGTPEASKVALALHALGACVIYDDYSEHAWSAQELEAGACSSGRRLLHPGS